MLRGLAVQECAGLRTTLMLIQFLSGINTQQKPPLNSNAFLRNNGYDCPLNRAIVVGSCSGLHVQDPRAGARANLDGGCPEFDR